MILLGSSVIQNKKISCRLSKNHFKLLTIHKTVKQNLLLKYYMEKHLSKQNFQKHFKRIDKFTTFVYITRHVIIPYAFSTFIQNSCTFGSLILKRPYPLNTYIHCRYFVIRVNVQHLYIISSLTIQKFWLGTGFCGFPEYKVRIGIKGAVHIL